MISYQARFLPSAGHTRINKLLFVVVKLREMNYYITRTGKIVFACDAHTIPPVVYRTWHGLKVLSCEMDPTEIWIIRQVFIKERSAEGFKLVFLLHLSHISYKLWIAQWSAKRTIPFFLTIKLFLLHLSDYIEWQGWIGQLDRFIYADYPPPPGQIFDWYIWQLAKKASLRGVRDQNTSVFKPFLTWVKTFRVDSI